MIINEHVLSASQTRRHIEALGRWFDFIALKELAAGWTGLVPGPSAW